ncbi:MAG TPA: hypothetical protein VGO52_02900 [Hyphomonadaceae bacterium]|nr:hypothetical protein [Hyphomonadaceae bacterium]
MRTILGIAALAVAGLSGLPSAQAQIFDTTTKIVLTGKTYTFEPVKPNAWVFIEVADIDSAGKPKPGATSNWTVRVGSEAMSSQGLTAETFADGTMITVTGFGLKHASGPCDLHPVTLKRTCMLDGRQLQLSNGCSYLIGAPDSVDKIDNSKCKPT